MDKPSFTSHDLKHALQRITKGSYNEVKLPQIKIAETHVVEDDAAESYEFRETSHAAEKTAASENDEMLTLLQDKDKQIELLKKTIKTIAQKKEPQEAYEVIKNENRVLKDQNAQLLSQITYTTQNTPDQNEIARYKEAVAKLSRDLNALKVENIDKEKKEFEEFIRISNECTALKEENSALTEQVAYFQKEQASQGAQEKQKWQSIQHVRKTSELEAKLSQAACEKATFLARIQELSQKNSLISKSKDEAHIKLEEAEKALQDKQAILEKLIAEYAENQERLQILGKTNTELKAALAEENEKTAELKQENELHTQELRVSQACIIERQQKLESEIQAHKAIKCAHEILQTDFSELQNQKKLIEQHLAKRIRQASILAKQLDEQKQANETLSSAKMQEVEQNAKLQVRLEQLEKLYEEKRGELLQKIAQLEEKTAKLSEQTATLTQEVHHKNIELEHMKKLKKRLQILEKLYSQFGEIVSTPDGTDSQENKPYIPQRLFE